MKDINVATNIKNSLSLIKIKLESDICGMWGMDLGTWSQKRKE
jgi:hypothetical protein